MQARAGQYIDSQASKYNQIFINEISQEEEAQRILTEQKKKRKQEDAADQNLPQTITKKPLKKNEEDSPLPPSKKKKDETSIPPTKTTTAMDIPKETRSETKGKPPPIIFKQSNQSEIVRFLTQKFGFFGNISPT